MNTIRQAPPRVLICAPLPPEFDKESGSRRIYHLVQLMRDEGWSVTFVCENAALHSPHVRHLRQLGVPTYVGFDGHTAQLIEAAEFDLAIFAFWHLAKQYADLVRRLSPRTRIVVETVDLHWLRNARRLLGERDGASGLLDDGFGSDLVSEMNTYARADGVLTVSEREASLINSMMGGRRLAHAVPDCDEVDALAPPFHGRRGIAFIGNFRHPPNVDAVEYFCRDILPLVRPDLREEHPVYVVGNGPTERVRELAASTEGVHLVGWVPTVIPYLQAVRTSVVPLRYGAGTKRKLVESLLAGTPVVTTPAGIEGIDVQDGIHLLVREDPRDFADAIERLLVEEGLWAGLSSSGRTAIMAGHGRDAARARLSTAVGTIMEGEARALADGAPDAPMPSEAEVVRQVVKRVLPLDSRVLVVSKGDPELVKLPGHVAGHFPQADDGRYAGYHPKNSRAAVQHLNELQGQADYLLFPSTALWWLDFYSSFARHMDGRFERVWSDEACVIFRLSGQTNGGRPSGATPESMLGAHPQPRRSGVGTRVASRIAPRQAP